MGRKAVFLDVDGTYLNDRGVPPGSARQAVVEARANGHLVFLCTGRSTAMLWEAITDAGFDGVVASAGGYVEVAGILLQHRTLPVPDVRHVVEFFDAHDVGYLLESASGTYGSPGCGERLRDRLFGDIADPALRAEMEAGFGGFLDRVVEDGDLLRTDIAKVTFFDSPLPIAAVRAEFLGTLEVLPSMVRRFGETSGELFLPGVHKAQGMAVLLDHLGIDAADAIAFGDGLNDLEMLSFAGTGIAMSGSHPQVLEAADGVTGTPEEDGIRAGFAALGLI